MKSFRLAVAAGATLLIAACANNDKAAVDSAAATLAGTSAISLADVAGTWQVRTTPLSGADTITNSYVLTATADTTGWIITFPSGLKVPLHATVSGDSVILKSGIYSSIRRKSVKVMTEGVARLQGGKLVGNTVAHYQGQKDSVLHLRFEGTKTP